MQEDTRMQLISEVARITGISASTIRAWARTQQLRVAERRPTLVGLAWYTTVAAVLERASQPYKIGRPIKKS